MAASCSRSLGGSATWEGWIQPNRPAAAIPGAGAGFAGRSSSGGEVGREVGPLDLGSPVAAREGDAGDETRLQVCNETQVFITFAPS